MVGSNKKIEAYPSRQPTKWENTFPFNLWSIWLTRNENYHEKLHKPIPKDLPRIRAIQFITLTENTKSTTFSIIQHNPHEASYKLNTDRSLFGNSKCGGIGELIRDQT